MKENSILAIFKSKPKKPVPGQGSKAKPAPVEKPAKGTWANPKPVFKAAEQPKVTAAMVKAEVKALKKDLAFLDKDVVAVKEMQLIAKSNMTKKEKYLAIVEVMKKHQSTK